MLRCGLRPVTPDRMPVIGHTGVPDVFINAGHGAMGWTFAAASGYLLCNSMLAAHGHPPLGIDIGADRFDVDRDLALSRFWGL